MMISGGGASPTTEIAQGSSSGTDVSLREYIQALRVADDRFEAERDRRFTEVAQEREKALKIKEEADKAALGLAREIQTYKDEKANELREQINSERGHYATKEDLVNLSREFTAIVKPLNDFVSQAGGVHEFQKDTREQRHTQAGVNSVYVGAITIGVMILIAIATVAAATNGFSR